MTPEQWSRGDQCENHDLSYCADCRELSGLVRHSLTGEVRYDKDCAVRTFMELTGAEYTEATDHMRAFGFSQRRGTQPAELRAAVEAAGYTVTETTLKAADLRYAKGRSFYVTAWKGKTGHAWSVVDGQVNRAYPPPYRYRAYEVTP